MINVTGLAFVHYQHPDLAKAATFLEDFGFQEVKKEDRYIYYAGFGKDPYCYVAEQSPDSGRHFRGAAWSTASKEDLERAASLPQASEVIENGGPGGGQIVTLTDPNGFPVHFIFGQSSRSTSNISAAAITRETDDDAAERTPTPNSAFTKLRKGAFRRFKPGPSPIHKLGHYGYFVPENKYEETFQWYTTTLNLKPTDAVFDPETGKDKTCFMHVDRGMVHTDHHSFFIGAGPSGTTAHVHHSSFEVNDFDTQSLGHNWLQSKGWKNCWGIGRHVLGSQIFDYWFDASGNILEHYSDGDIVNDENGFERSPEAPESLYIWGPNVPLAFLTGKMSDVGKGVPTSAPNVVLAS